MAATRRNYQAEYQRRIANAERSGLSRSQARGHARTSESPTRSNSASTGGDRFEAALKLYRQSGNQATAAKAVGLAPERLRRFMRENVQVTGRGRSLKITDNRPRIMTVATGGEYRQLRLRGFDQASLNGRHEAAIGHFLSTNDGSYLTPFEGKSAVDTAGKSHPLETDPNALYRLAHADDGVFHNIYRLVSNGG